MKKIIVLALLSFIGLVLFLSGYSVFAGLALPTPFLTSGDLSPIAAFFVNLLSILLDALVWLLVKAAQLIILLCMAIGYLFMQAAYEMVAYIVDALQITAYINDVVSTIDSKINAVLVYTRAYDIIELLLSLKGTQFALRFVPFSGA